MQNKRILLVGASPDRYNRNSVMRSYVAEGIVSVLGADALLRSSLQEAPLMVELSRPKTVLVFGSCMPDDSDYLQLYWACQKAQSCLVFWLHDDPYEFDFHYKILPYADFIFSNDRWCSLHYEQQRVWHLPMAASPSAHWRSWDKNKSVDLFFCGVAFPNRVSLIRDMSRLMTKYSVEIVGADWPNDLPFCTNRRLANMELADRYANSLATLNLGRNFNLANDRYRLSPSTPGPRTFEAAMSAACQLFFVDSLEIEDYFLPNEEILLFDSVEELAALVKELKESPSLAQAIGEAAQARCLSDHTYAQRIRKMLQVIGWND